MRMSRFTRAVDATIDKMHKTGGTGKGVYGEQAVLRICELLYQQQGGIVYHSFVYPCDPTKAGNIKVNQFGNLVVEPNAKSTEIDVLYVTQNRVFPIEIKAYKAKEITLTADRIYGCYKTDKSPIHQNEMHARHLYHAIYKSLPDGKSSYIRPIVVFVDKCKIIDQRPDWQLQYIYKATLDTLPTLLQALDKPGDALIDLVTMENTLKNICISYEVNLPLRIR